MFDQVCICSTIVILNKLMYYVAKQNDLRLYYLNDISALVHEKKSRITTPTETITKCNTYVFSTFIHRDFRRWNPTSYKGRGNPVW